jgi:hypothetical protein
MDLSARRKEKQRARDGSNGFELGGVAGAGTGDIGRVVSTEGTEMDGKDGKLGDSSASVMGGVAGQVDALDTPPTPFNRLDFIKQHITQYVLLFNES